MNAHKLLLILFLGIFALLAPVSQSRAAETVLDAPTLFTNQNWKVRTQPDVASFTHNDDGTAYGTTTTGIPFSQYPIPNTAGLRIEKFEMQDHFHYIVEGRIVYTTEELSVILASLHS